MRRLVYWHGRAFAHFSQTAAITDYVAGQRQIRGR